MKNKNKNQKPFYVSCLGVVSYHSNRKVSMTEAGTRSEVSIYDGSNHTVTLFDCRK